MNSKEKLILFLDSITIPQRTIKYLVENFDFDSLIQDVSIYKNDIVYFLGEPTYLKLKSAISIKNIENCGYQQQNNNRAYTAQNYLNVDF